ncbi:PKS-NRPS hybrid synthetase [Frankliniella fusca]|uniref:PKS-NRPS hybrid synthetase n=1 Tax=Frankliniella fusca TaxID=407009 RepID=A0AAE1L5B1_9NEOP|nr:PKS-NRPS hybrid synthetase [Frankliniella fusca]
MGSYGKRVRNRIVHGNVNGKWLPLVIALLERKTRATYEHLFEVLKEEVRRRLRKTLAPAAVSTDYEQGAIKAAQEIFPDCQVFGCLFHFGQVLWRKLQVEGLAVAYRTEENEQMRTDFHCLIAIAFVPVDDVEEVFDALAAGADAALNAVFQHVEENFLRGRLRARRRGGRVLTRAAPMFPPDIWNCYERTVQGLPRTTNTCEAWHRRLGTLVGKHHPSLFVFLDQLQEEIGEVDVQITRAEGGYTPVKRRSALEAAEARINRIVERYAEYKEHGDVPTYIQAIGHNLGGRFH